MATYLAMHNNTSFIILGIIKYPKTLDKFNLFAIIIKTKEKIEYE